MSLEFPPGLEGSPFRGPRLVLRLLLAAGEFPLPFAERLRRRLRFRVEPPQFRLPSGQFVIALLQEFRLRVEVRRGLGMTFLPDLKIRPFLLKRRGPCVEFARLRRSGAGGLQVLGQGSRMGDLGVQLRLEPGRFRLPLELPSLEGFLRFAQVGAERLDFFRLRGKVPIPGFELLPGLGHLPGMARVFRRGLLRRFLLRLLEPLLSLLQGALSFLQGPQVPFHFEDALGRRAGHLPRFRLPRPDLRLGPAEGRLATRELLRLRLDGFGLRVQF